MWRWRSGWRVRRCSRREDLLAVCLRSGAIAPQSEGTCPVVHVELEHGTVGWLDIIHAHEALVLRWSLSFLHRAANHKERFDCIWHVAKPVVAIDGDLVVIEPATRCDLRRGERMQASPQILRTP